VTVGLIARFPRLAAWIVCGALMGAVTVEAVIGLGLAGPAVPAGAEHVHGIVVAVRPTGVFALRVAGHAGALWFHPAAGASISLAHLWRHLRERAGTDVVYQVLRSGFLVAWRAD
jgi:hypothetical protein